MLFCTEIIGNVCCQGLCFSLLLADFVSGTLGLQFGTLGRLAGEALPFLGASFWHFSSGDCGHEAIPSCFLFEAIPSPI